MKVRQLEILYGYTHLLVLVNLVGAVVVSAFLRHVVHSPSLAVWFLFGLSLAGARIAAQRAFNRDRQLLAAKIPVTKWRHMYLFLAAATGMQWGLTAVLIYPENSLTYQVFVAFICGGVTAASVPIYSVGRLSFAIFALPALMPLACRFLIEFQDVQMALGVMLVLFVLALLFSAHETGRVIRTNMALSHALYYRATHDSLVGLVNHGEFQRRLVDLAEVAKSSRQPYALIFIDLDLFKRVNDAGGHITGDRMLCEIGKILRTKVRKIDTAARVGGDEFAVILEDCGKPEAVRIARSLLNAISGFTLEHKDCTYRVGASVGVAYSKDGQNTASEMLRAADQACYVAKEAGRNRIEVAAATSRLGSTGRFELLRELAGMSQRTKAYID